MNTTLLSITGIAPLPHLGVIRAQGADAARFLQSQLTQDFSLQTPSQARLAAFLSAKGRMQASFIGIKRSDTEVVLVCSLDLLAATLKRLSMFVMRSQVKLSDATAEFILLGLVGMGDTTAQEDAPLAPPWTVSHIGEAAAVQLYPAAGQNRALWLAPTGTPVPEGQAIETSTWAWSEVMSGVATLSAPVVELFVPQMLNYESIGGVNFKKGCYPGQEVVARSQFRGAIKRRTYLASVDTAVAVGDEVFTADDTSQPCGVVVQVAPVLTDSTTPAGAHNAAYNALVCIQTSATNKALQVGSNAAARLHLLPLPYALLEDI